MIVSGSGYEGMSSHEPLSLSPSLPLPIQTRSRLTVCVVCVVCVCRVCVVCVVCVA
jgi:hypothetical protein